VRIIVDGMNVIGSRPDGWWRDRPAARRALIASLRGLVGPANEVTVVFDGEPLPGEIEDASSVGIEALFAPGGPDAADRAIAALVADLSSQHPYSELLVVTSDDALAREVHAFGVHTEGSGTFRSRLPRSGA